MIVLHLLGLDAALADGDATLQTGIAAAAVAGEDFDAIQRRHDAALHAAVSKGLVPLQGTIDIYQHGFQRRQRKPAQAIAEDIVLKGTRCANPVLEGGMSDFSLQLLKAAQAE